MNHIKEVIEKFMSEWYICQVCEAAYREKVVVCCDDCYDKYKSEG
jgi:recombinational DNA repair protein RecR